MKYLGLIMHETVFEKNRIESSDLAHNLSSLSLTQSHHGGINS
jgi:hypothetical protein